VITDPTLVNGSEPVQVLDEFKDNSGISGAVQSLYHIATKAASLAVQRSVRSVLIRTILTCLCRMTD
jgi:hypothetical protein